MIKTNLMIATVAASAGVAQGQEPAKKFATAVYGAAEDYTDLMKQSWIIADTVLKENYCPADLRTILKDDKGNYIVLIGEQHTNEDHFKATEAAEKVVDALKTKPEGDVQRIAAIELPILESEDKVQWQYRPEEGTEGKQPDCNRQFRAGMINKPNCKVPTEFEGETEHVAGDKTVVGSGAGRGDKAEKILQEVYKMGVKSKQIEGLAQRGDYRGSINHSIFELNAKGAGVELKGGEPAKAFLKATQTVQRNEWAAGRLAKLATKDQEKKTVVVMSYGALHLCAKDSSTTIQTTQVQLLERGWKCEEGCDFIKPNARTLKYKSERDGQYVNGHYDEVRQPQPQQQHQQLSPAVQQVRLAFPWMTAEEAQQKIDTYVTAENAIYFMLQDQQHQQQQQQFSEEEIENVRSAMNKTKEEAIALLKRHGSYGGVLNASFCD